MPVTSLPPAVRADKALARQVAVVDESLECVEEFAGLIRADGARAGLRKEAALLRRRLAEALTGKDPGTIAKAAAALVKEAARLADKASEACSKDLYERASALLNKARGLLAQGMVEVGRIEPASLRAPLQKEQAALRKALDALESERCATPGGIAALEKMLPEIEGFLRRLEPARKAGDWMRSSYLPVLARVEAAIKRVPAERCRKSLLAELDFVEADTHQALLKGDVRPVQARSLPTLQRIERLAVRVVAASPAVDRELARLARLVGTGRAPALARKLKATIQAKATAWPAGVDADTIEAAMSAFEAGLAQLAGEIGKAAAVQPTAKS